MARTFEDQTVAGWKMIGLGWRMELCTIATRDMLETRLCCKIHFGLDIIEVQAEDAIMRQDFT